jgi:tRNA pseudouridine55 synthase
MSILLLNKDKGMTSFYALKQAQKNLGFSKAGHGGTLDPLATGLLPIFFEQSTKFLQYFNTESKEYIAEYVFGISSNTEDISGILTYSETEEEPTEDQICKVLDSFLGEQAQLPPKFSAKKINGTPMYKLARRGKEFDRKEQKINILEINLLEYKFPTFKIKVSCSKGTYVRTLGVDIGKRLNQSVSLCGLQRTKFGHLNLDDSISLAELKNLDKNQKMQYVRRVEEILIDIPQVEIRSSEVKKFQNGCQLEAREIEKTGKHFIFYKKELLGLGLVDNELQINPLKVLTKGEKKENELK